MGTPREMTGPLNLGNPAEITILELTETIVEMTGSNSALTFQPLPHEDPRQRKPDIGRATATLGWQPKIRLRDGLRRTIDFFEG
jgi:UDP-glucuronate decarboxylase